MSSCFLDQRDLLLKHFCPDFDIHGRRHLGLVLTELLFYTFVSSDSLQSLKTSLLFSDALVFKSGVFKGASDYHRTPQDTTGHHRTP